VSEVVQNSFSKFFVFGECNFYEFYGQKLFFFVFLGGFLGFLRGLERNFKDYLDF
jgi:hypothetical protein